MEKERIKLIEAFASLLNEKPFESIGRKMLTVRADLPDAAFGYCFHDMYAVAEAFFDEERAALTSSGISPENGGEAFLLSVSFALRFPQAAKNIALSTAAGIYKKNVSLIAAKYFSEVVLRQIGDREPGDRERDAVRFMRAAAVGLATKEMIRADDVKAEAEKYTDLFDVIVGSL